MKIYKTVKRQNFPTRKGLLNCINTIKYITFVTFIKAKTGWTQHNILPVFLKLINQAETTHPLYRAEMTHLWNWAETTRPSWAETTHSWNRAEMTRAETTWPNGNRPETIRIHRVTSKTLPVLLYWQNKNQLLRHVW